MNERFADTSYFVALLNPQDSVHHRAARLTTEFVHTVVTSEWVIAELAAYMSRPPLRRLFSAMFEEIRADPLFVILPADHAGFEQGLDMFVKHQDKAWSLADCISFAIMRERGIHEALTADHHFEQAGFISLLK